MSFIKAGELSHLHLGRTISVSIGDTKITDPLIAVYASGTGSAPGETRLLVKFKNIAPTQAIDRYGRELFAEYFNVEPDSAVTVWDTDPK